MKLDQFRVRNFRSVDDSGWITCEEVTTLVGINEAGKSNIILALWKLNPARGGDIDPLQDMPMSKYAQWRSATENVKFIEAKFLLDDDEISDVINLCGCDQTEASVACVTRYYDGHRTIGFSNFKSPKSIDPEPLKMILNSAIEDISNLEEKTKGEAGIQARSIASYKTILELLENINRIEKSDVGNIVASLYVDKTLAKTSEISPRIEQTTKLVEEYLASTEPINPTSVPEVRQYIVDHMPTFVYYSNYGNLDAQIYLPHAIKWLKGEVVEGVETNEDKVRTLRVLFDYVKLDPKEILELGRAPITTKLDNYNREIHIEVKDDQVEEHMEHVEERFALLSSASVSLTSDFKEWWKQGDYRFRLQADSDFFRILVSDEKRSDEIGLEKRSTGLQWFLSFFLVFLVESQRAHKNSILLLDEAGMSLHPLAQKDLIAFFDGLSQQGQIIHTTHSPFLIDTTNIDRVRAVYSDDQGHTVVSSDLRAMDNKASSQSIYAAHAALGLTVSDILLQGCQPVIVEGPSDQHYYNAIKIFLIRNGYFAPHEEIVFLPSGGVRGVASIAAIIGGVESNLPAVLVDSDKSGEDFRNKLCSHLYSGDKDRILSVGDYTDFENAETEDLIPINLMTRYLDRLFRSVESEYIEDYLDASRPRVRQIEEFAQKHGVELPKGWKVELAKSSKKELLKKSKTVIDEKTLSRWTSLFTRINDLETKKA